MVFHSGIMIYIASKRPEIKGIIVTCMHVSQKKNESLEGILHKYSEIINYHIGSINYCHGFLEGKFFFF